MAPNCSSLDVHNVDYDRTEIPAGYDRGRDHGPEVLDLWMRTIESRLAGSRPDRVLDLGCGTGRFSDALSIHFDADVMGVDPSLKMLARANSKQRQGRVHYLMGRAEAIPLESQSIDLIFMSMVLHHFVDHAAAVAECRRVLRDDGMVFVRTGTREQVPFYPYYPFFPASHPILEEILPSGAAVRQTFEAGGFRQADFAIIDQVIAPSWEAFADKLAANADSVLARLDRQDFDTGINAVRSHGARVGSQAIVEPIDLFVFR
jgi:ubiquinone/menaquinone biosynthesis C-methylase UbiE